ncbi:MAG: right-handed parallel beta-helix repeat-containing protein [Verrucomicrobiaceae bacterium]|nr:MAG: right-handed parallel beta-helix repeat-containing protein [Verrucomicrobiaceae bacterium]
MKILLRLLVIPLMATSAMAQGPLNPAAPPAPTMKTLGEIEGRTPVSTLPFNITASGSYYLTKNLQFTATTGNAVNISASNVTLDLSGFSLSSVDGVSGSAIAITGGRTGIRIRNGSIKGNSSLLISGLFPGKSWSFTAKGFYNGISGPDCSACDFSDLMVTDCQADGLDLGGSNLVRRVNARGNGGYGIDTNADGNRVTGCTSSRNANSGIYCVAGVITGCVVTENGNNGMTSSSSHVSGCSSRLNFSHGFNTVSAVIQNCTAESNGGSGFIADFSNISLSCARNNNQRAGSFVDLSGASAVRYGNLPTP